MTDYTSYKIEIIEGINDDPVPANFNNNGRGPNGSYFIQKYNAFLDAASATVDADETVKTSATDTTAGFLQDKLVAGDNITITLTAPGENESLTIAGTEPYAITNGLSEAGFFTLDGLFEVTIAGATYARWDLGNPVGSTGCIAIGEDALLTPDVAAYNIAIGTECLKLTTEGTDNVAFGSYALSANTTGGQNTAVGSYSLLLNTSGSDNVAIGCFSLWNNTVGVKNIALGDYALRDAVSASANVCVGHSTGLKTTGETNTYVGSECAMANTSGGANTALGYYALANSETGSWNVAVGRDAAFGTAGVSVGGLVAVGAQALKVTAASDNTAMGYQALTNATTGLNNVAVGHTAASTLTTGSNVICIGQNAQPSATTVSNEITLGNASIASLRCAVTSITSLSDRRDKTDIQPLSVGLDLVNTLNPVQFTWNTRDGAKVGQQAAGFIAQDLQEAQSGNEYLNLVLDNNPDRLEATPGNLIPVLVKAIQELAEKVEQQSSQIETLKAQIA